MRRQNRFARAVLLLGRAVERDPSHHRIRPWQELLRLRVVAQHLPRGDLIVPAVDHEIARQHPRLHRRVRHQILHLDDDVALPQHIVGVGIGGSAALLQQPQRIGAV